MIVAREAAILAPFALHSVHTAGRRYAEPPHPYRGPFQRDRDRITHSGAYRRLADKTQVFTGELGDYHRSRLTHTLEVNSVARNLGRALRLNEDLIETLALAHDLGHPPFGHSGETVLDECLHDQGGFSHNRQCLRIVEQLEQRYPDFPGLNLSLEVLAGQATRADRGAATERPPLEVQVVDAADSVAYDTHDADDALKLGLLELDELLEIPLWQSAARQARRRYQALSRNELKRAVLHELLNWQVGDLLEHTQRRIAAAGVHRLDDVRAAPVLVAPGDELAPLKSELERFLYLRVYRHPQVLEMRAQAQQMLREMFAALVARPSLLPAVFAERVAESGLERTVGDYLAGMTDRYAAQQHTQICRSV
ncbi:MAG: deoxyguanosinetriphosphate triphosphohydrolase [Pirellulales bacterium]|nr:deoxyguanosinetriphosphate triphosphohydrolase [Pirellulales bacterium]